MTLPIKSNNNTSNINKRLSVQISLTGLSFLVTTSDKEDVLFFYEEKFDTSTTPEEILSSIQITIESKPELANNTYSTVTIVYATNLYTLVPISLFDETKASDYLKFNSKILANDFISYDSVENHDLVVVYVPYININNYFFEKYGSFKYYHASTILINTILQAEKISKESKVYLNVQSETFDCLIVSSGELVLCNTFSYKTPEDFIYYLLFCMEQLKLNPDSTKVILAGAIEKDDNLFEIIYEYVRNVSFITDNFSSLKLSQNTKQHNQFVLKNSL